MAESCYDHKTTVHSSDNSLYLTRVVPGPIENRNKPRLELDDEYRETKELTEALIYKYVEEIQHYILFKNINLIKPVNPKYIIVSNKGNLIAHEDECGQTLFHLGIYYNKDGIPEKSYVYGESIINQNLMDLHPYYYECNIKCIISENESRF